MTPPDDAPADLEDAPELAPVEELFAMLQEAELPFPPMPRELADRLEEVGPWLYATRPIEASPYEAGLWLDEVLEGVEDYVLVGHAGYGLSSWAMHYYLVFGGLAVIAQVRWGHATSDDEKAAARLRDCIQAVEDLYVETEVARAEGRLAPDERIVVVEHPRAGSLWARVKIGTSRDEAPWQTAPNAALAALASLQA